MGALRLQAKEPIVFPSVITGIIDWQSSSIQPAFEYADYVPDFVASVIDASQGEKPAECRLLSADRLFLPAYRVLSQSCSPQERLMMTC